MSSQEASKETISGLENIVVNVTGHDDSGKEIFVSSTPAEWKPYTDGKLGMSILYTTQFNANLNGDEDIEKHKTRMATTLPGLVNPGGTLLRMVDFAPGDPGLMHRTKSLDYGIVVKGELEAIMESGEKRIMRQGDVCVQRGTSHAWRNLSETEWARMVFVLQDVQPIVLGGEKLKEDFRGKTVDIPPSLNDE
ncbi:Cupin-domain-containing oxidoreductase srdB [Cladobotryum mycophilum]|uniref:Cupin-domain-containing oxidoreductase srdB n=1 Tax=Cladobotryum mycophilum TaxID=491253 RepID=A0ABR0SU37_9HYPO